MMLIWGLCVHFYARVVFFSVHTHTIVPPYRLCCADIRRAVSAECIFCFVFGAMFVIARAVKLCTTQRGSRARVLKAKWFGNERHVDGRDACVCQSGGEFFASVSVCARPSEWEWSGVSVCVLAGFRAEFRRHVKSIRKLRNLCTRGRSLGEFNVSGHILWSCMCFTNMYIHTKYAPFTVCSIYRCGCLIYSSNVTHTHASLWMVMRMTHHELVFFTCVVFRAVHSRVDWLQRPFPHSHITIDPRGTTHTQEKTHHIAQEFMRADINVSQSVPNRSRLCGVKWTSLSAV